MENRALQLCLNHLVLLAGLALFFHFANAENHFQTVSQSQLHFVLQYLVILVVVSTTLAVTEDAVLRSGGFNHLGAHFACESTFLFVSAVFGSHFDRRTFQHLCHCCQMDKRRADNDSAFRVLYVFFQLCSQCYTFLQGLVHFPVACNHFDSCHCCI